ALMVMRDRFDNLLTERAADAGAEVLDGSPVRTLRRRGDGFEIVAGEHRLTAGFVAGADGANSLVARATGVGTGMAQSVALEAEVCAPRHALARWRGLLNVDFGYRPWGYGWVFPKARHLSVGLVLPPEQGRDARAHLARYLERLGLGEAGI